MNSFSQEWLELREPIDHAARSEEILSGVSHYFVNDEELLITDIGCGTGSTLRALKPYLSNQVSWHLIDHDDSLMDEARKHAHSDPVNFSICDLSRDLDPVFEPKPDLLTTSAFLDLVSRPWLEKFVMACVDARLPVYAALSYDGRAETLPEHVDEELILSAFNRHQQTDKGFGSALGPASADAAITLFRDAGYTVAVEPSDWHTDEKNPVFQSMLLEGWRDAALGMEPGSAKRIERWFDDRINQIDSGRCEVTVGHKDFFAFPADQ